MDHRVQGTLYLKTTFILGIISPAQIDPCLINGSCNEISRCRRRIAVISRRNNDHCIDITSQRPRTLSDID